MLGRTGMRQLAPRRSSRTASSRGQLLQRQRETVAARRQQQTRRSRREALAMPTTDGIQAVLQQILEMVLLLLSHHPRHSLACPVGVASCTAGQSSRAVSRGHAAPLRKQLLMQLVCQWSGAGIKCSAVDSIIVTMTGTWIAYYTCPVGFASARRLRDSRICTPHRSRTST
jgi:hypothetical protein